jgi:APA family basic amino acid/polyamine antiporter
MNESGQGRDPRHHLKRSISLVHLVGIEIGQCIGAGIFALTGIALARTGPSLPLAFLAAAAAVSVVMAVLAMLGSALPVSGGTYFYGSRFFSPTATFIGVWGYILGALVGMFPLYALTGAAFLKAVFPAVPVTPTAVLLLFFFYAVNLVGARLASWIQVVLVVVLVSALLFYIGSGLPVVSRENLMPLFPGGIGGFAVASSILIFTLLGANSAVELGDEIIEPERNIPRSFLISIPAVTLVYCLIGLTAAGTCPWNEAGGLSLSSIAGRVLQGWPFIFFSLGGGFLAVLTTLNASFLWGTKSLMVIAADGLFPRSLAAVNRRFGTPHWLLTLVFAVSSLSLIAAGERIETFAVIASFGAVLIFFPVMGAALRLRSLRPDIYGRSRIRLKGFLYIAAPVAGILLGLLIGAILLVDLASQKSGGFFIALLVVWIAAGALYARLRVKQLGKARHNPFGLDPPSRP